MKFSADALPSILTTEGREGVPGPLEGGGRGLRATPSLYHSCPGHMEGFIFFWWGVQFLPKFHECLGSAFRRCRK